MGIDSTQRVIKQEDVSSTVDSTSQGHALLLATTQVDALDAKILYWPFNSDIFFTKWYEMHYERYLKKKKKKTRNFIYCNLPHKCSFEKFLWPFLLSLSCHLQGTCQGLAGEHKLSPPVGTFCHRKADPRWCCPSRWHSGATPAGTHMPRGPTNVTFIRIFTL